MLRVIELVRVSTAGQAAEDRASIPSQKAINRKTAQSFGLTIVKTVELSDVSGTQVLLTPEIQQMILLMRDSEIHGVVAREFSRLMRPENFLDYAFLQTFYETNTILYLPEGPIDFGSKTGRLMGTIRAAMAGMERSEILERMWAAKEEKRKSGGFSQSKICLPFAVDYNGGWAYTSKARQVREAFRCVLSGTTSYTEIERTVGIRAYNLRNILRNPIYTGWRVIDQRRDPSPRAKKAGKDGRQADRPKIQRAPEEVIRVKVIDEPLVSESDFAQVQRILTHKREHFQRMNSGPHRFTYNGYLACKCGSILYTKFRRDDYYICRDKCGAGYQRKDRLEPELDCLFQKRLTSPSFLRRHILAPLRQTKQPADDSERLRAELVRLDAKRSRILDSYFEGVITSAERDTRTADVDRDRKVTLGLIAKQRPVPGITLETLVQVFAPFAEFDLLDREDKRRLLNTLTPSIVVSNYKVEGLWIGSPCSEEIKHMDKDAQTAGTEIRHWIEIAA